MFHKSRFLFILILTLIAGVVPSLAQGVILPNVDTDPSTLSIDYLRVNTTIDNQVAHTEIDMQFTNNADRLAEGTYVFPLPAEAAVDQLVMYVDGVAIEAKILEAGEARQVYNEIVRRLADPALLEYVGTNAIQANIFPIPPHESRRIQIAYSEILQVDNGLVHYSFPMHNAGNEARPIKSMSVSVDVKGSDEISNIYSPTHNIAISREGDNSFKAGYEGSNIIPQSDFSLYYGIANNDINVNLLTYRESANEDGFFMLLVQPPTHIEQSQILPKDVIIVLDQSGSMDGDKWNQAREAAKYVLEHLNPNDRFNVIPFSTGWRIYSNDLAPASDAQGAINWIDSLYAEGGTDINGALSAALDMVDESRQTTVLFMTDGLATEGITETDAILQNLSDKAAKKTRIFSFGVGDDVDTFLLDAIVRDFDGTGSYVRPSERIDEEVASLFNKISSPVLNDVVFAIDGVVAELMYPKTTTDLFAGEQLIIVGRFRGASDSATVNVTGIYNDIPETYTFVDQKFPANAGGEAFIPRLWATRRIGDLLNAIRLNGESKELVDSVVDLSIRYGIITPYTSFLITEDDILSQDGRSRAVDDFADEAQTLATNSTGAGAVNAADASIALSNASAPAQPSLGYVVSEEEMDVNGTVLTGGTSGGTTGGTGGEMTKDFDDGEQKPIVNPIQTVGEKTFILQGDVWTDTTFTPDTMETQKITFLSDEYFDLLTETPALSEYFSVGEQVIVVVDGVAYQVVPDTTK